MKRTFLDKSKNNSTETVCRGRKTMNKDMCVACDDGSKYTFPWTNPYIANIVMPCNPLIFTLNAPLRAVKICPSSETSVCAPETSALVR